MMTLAQAAVRLGVSPTTLRNQVLLGRLQATLYGKTYLVTAEEVERYRAETLGRHGRPAKPKEAPVEDKATPTDAAVLARQAEHLDAARGGIAHTGGAARLIQAEHIPGRTTYVGVLRAYHPDREPGERIGDVLEQCTHAHRFARAAVDCARRLSHGRPPGP